VHKKKTKRALNFFLPPRRIINKTQDETKDMFEMGKTDLTAKI